MRSIDKKSNSSNSSYTWLPSNPSGFAFLKSANHYWAENLKHNTRRIKKATQIYLNTYDIALVRPWSRLTLSTKNLRGTIKGHFYSSNRDCNVKNIMQVVLHNCSPSELDDPLTPFLLNCKPL